MLHLIAAGWDKLEDHDQPEVASFAKGIINAMTPKQIRRQAPVHGTCVHACAEAGAGAFFRFLLEHGGGDCTQVRCAPDPEPAHKPAKTVMDRFRKMLFAAAPGVKPRAKESDAKTPLEAARAALGGLEAEETSLRRAQGRGAPGGCGGRHDFRRAVARGVQTHGRRCEAAGAAGGVDAA